MSVLTIPLIKLQNLRKTKIHMKCIENLLQGPANCDTKKQKL